MKFRGILSLALILLASPALAQVNPGTSPLSIAKGGTAASTASAARSSLGLAIGTDVEAWNADLDCIASLSATGILKRTGSGTCSAGSAAAADLTNGTTGSGAVVLSTGPTFSGAITFNGSTSGATQLSAAAVAGGTLTLPAATDVLVARTTADVLTNKTFNCASNTCTVRLPYDVTGTLNAANFPALTGDVTTSAGSLATHLATVNSDVGSYGGASSVPSFTVNAKGLITAAAATPVVAPAGTLSGTTLNSTVVGSSLTSVGALGAGSATTGFTIDATHVGWTGTVPAANLPLAANASGSPSATAGTVKCDGTTVTCSSGVVTAIGSAATSVADGTTTISSGVPGTFVFNNAGTLSHLALRGYIAGLTLSTAGSSSTFGIATGVAADSTAARMMALVSAYTKTTSAWAVGSGSGALDTGTIANNTWYHAFLIERTDTGVVDVLISTSATSPALPANYTLFRRIGSMKTDGSGNWLSFSQFGDEFLWGVGSAINDINTTTLGTTPTLFTLRVPTGVKVWAKLRMDSIASSVLVSSPDEGALAFNTPVSNQTTNSSTSVASLTLDIRTNTSAQVQAVAAISNQTFQATAFGWIDRRGRDN